jgi:beta-phosphoglucomutase
LEIQGLLFDLDETLVHTQEANLKAYNFALLEYGLGFSSEEFKSTNGMDSRKSLAEVFPHLTNAEIDNIREIKASVYHKFLSNTFLNEPLSSLIDCFLGHKRLGIVTTGKKLNVFEILEFHNLREKFNVIITGDDTINPKPSPEPYLKAIEIFDLPPARILAFEDSQIGCDSAIAAGLQVFRVSNGFVNEE